MEKEINRLLRWLQGEFILAWMLVLLLIALYETDVLPARNHVGGCPDVIYSPDCSYPAGHATYSRITKPVQFFTDKLFKKKALTRSIKELSEME